LRYLIDKKQLLRLFFLKKRFIEPIFELKGIMSVFISGFIAMFINSANLNKKRFFLNEGEGG
jgi:hypothetical protein